MEFLGQNEEKKGINKGFVIGIAVGVVVIAVTIGLLLLRPPAEDQMARVLEGSYHEGSPEFEQLTKDIIISTSDKTVQSPDGFGRISMFIVGKIRNKGTKTINALEVNVAVVDSFNAVVKEKRVLVVPRQQERLGPGELIPITLQLAGFDKNDDRANIRWKVTAIRTEN